jgi:hypothetical protein
VARTGSGSVAGRRGGRFAAAALAAAAVAGLLAVAGVAGTSAPAGSPAPAGFRLVDGSLGCAFAAHTLTCATAGDRNALSIDADGAVRSASAARAQVQTSVRLRPGERWLHGGISCLAAPSRVVCTAAGERLTLVG